MLRSTNNDQNVLPTQKLERISRLGYEIIPVSFESDKVSKRKRINFAWKDAEELLGYFHECREPKQILKINQIGRKLWESSLLKN